MNTISFSLNGLESVISLLYQKANMDLMSLMTLGSGIYMSLLVDCCGMIKT